MATQIQLRRGIASEWTSENPTLAAGEAGVETDTGQLKIGDGSTAWNSLDYAGASEGGGGGVENIYACFRMITDDAPLTDSFWAMAPSGYLLYLAGQTDSGERGIYETNGTTTLTEIATGTVSTSTLITCVRQSTFSGIMGSGTAGSTFIVTPGWTWGSSFTDAEGLRANAANIHVTTELNNFSNQDIYNIVKDIDGFFGTTGSVPTPPAEGTFYLTSVDGVLSWTDVIDGGA